MGDYFAHWLNMQAKIGYPPKVFVVNWFRQDAEGKFLWPGYGENMRVLKWIVDRSRVRVGGQETILGWVPKAGDLDLSGVDVPSEQVDAATRMDLRDWKVELESQGGFFEQLGSTMPRALELYRQVLLARLATTEAGAV
jgi:phosphoenolpyruvate carboxykinase (GTP)